MSRAPHAPPSESNPAPTRTKAGAMSARFIRIVPRTADRLGSTDRHLDDVSYTVSERLGPAATSPALDSKKNAAPSVGRRHDIADPSNQFVPVPGFGAG